jgi:aspartate/methionine/tyrosine aminotransferase
VILLSASKIFSYAGQRVALSYLSPKLSERKFDALEKRFNRTKFIDAFVLCGMYCTTSGVPASPQYGLRGLLKKANSGKLNFLEHAAEYAVRAKAMRKIMTENGFNLVYAEDLEEPLSDGFFFSFSYPGMSGAELTKELLYFGISSTTLRIARSKRDEAVRACVSQIQQSDFPEFEKRIKAFHLAQQS